MRTDSAFLATVFLTSALALTGSSSELDSSLLELSDEDDDDSSEL
jgi:hypothetical protein